jgi:glutaredoxin|tara:strand:+ start:1695 stop:1973 length:279 start_codon:yes stop_codon:yes gene_type:complete
MTLTLYSQDRCNWCDRLKEHLTTWGYEYKEINISEEGNALAKDFLKHQGHRTVPQLYQGQNDMLQGNSALLTKGLLESRIVVEYPDIAEASF